MFRLFILFTCLGLFFSSCDNKSNQEFTKYYEDGRAKPSIVLSSIIDTTSFDLPWSLSDEFHNLLRSSFAAKGSLYINEEVSDTLSHTKNPFSEDLSWVKKEYSPNEFVIFMEFIQHDQVPAKMVQDPSESVSTNLNMAVRIRLVDIRGSSPKVVLQQIIKDSFFSPKNLLPVDYNTVTWGTSGYENTPLRNAHFKFSQTLVDRLSDYILLAKSRWDG